MVRGDEVVCEGIRRRVAEVEARRSKVISVCGVYRMWAGVGRRYVGTRTVSGGAESAEAVEIEKVVRRVQLCHRLVPSKR